MIGHMRLRILVGVVLVCLGGLGARVAAPVLGAAQHPILFVLDRNASAVYAYDASNFGGAPLAKITDGMTDPESLAVDPVTGDVYVSTPYGSTLTVYPRGTTRPSRTIPVGGAAQQMAFSADRTLVVPVYHGDHRNLTMLVFDRGSLAPTRKMVIPLRSDNVLVFSNGVAIDAHDNIFLGVTQYPHGPRQQLEFPAGSTTARVTQLPDGVAETFDAAGNFYVATTSTIAEYAPGATRPLRTIRDGLFSVGQMSVAPDGTLFVPNTETYFSRGDLVEYAPNSTRPEAKLTTADDTYPVVTAISP